MNTTVISMNKIELMRNVIEGTSGKIASVTFVKKDGSTRKMQFRTGVKAGIVENPRICSNGTSDTTAHIDYYIKVSDMNVAKEAKAEALAAGKTEEEAKVIAAKKSYRIVNLSTITAFKCGDIELNIA